MKTRFLKLLSVILTVLMISGSVSVALAAPAGAGTENDPVVIANAEDFAALAADPAAYDGKYISLAGDIELASEEVLPIGTPEAPFKGIFDGCGFKVKGTGEQYGEIDMDNFGVFGVTEGAVIKNVTVYGMNFSCGNNVAALVGYAKDTAISGVTVYACGVEADSNAGGVVGLLEGGSVADCRISAVVQLYEGNNVGGIVGCVNGGEVLRCVNDGNVVAENKNVGGIVGYCDGTVSHCINKGSVSSTDTDNSSSAGVAGIVGYLNGTLSACGNVGDISSELQCAGVFCATGAANVSYCYNAGSLTSGGLDDVIGFADDNDAVDHCVGVSGTVSLADLETAAAYEGWDFETVWFEPANYHGYPYPVLRDCHFHELQESVKSPASCVDAEVISVKCVALHAGEPCSFEYEKVGEAALGHQMDWITTKKPTCVDDGEKVMKCTRTGCGYTDETTVTVIPATEDHKDADGDNECDVCGKIMKEPEQEQEVKKNFFQKIIDFFKRIFDWIRNLFTRNKD